jgi:hypothetical protein
MDIITRFNFGSNYFNGRAYIFNSDFETAYGNVKNAVQHMKKMVEGPKLTDVREKKFSLTNAIMWGDGKYKMIDFFGIGESYSLNNDWGSNPEVFSWITKNGIIQPREGVTGVTCEKGMIIIAEELKYRRITIDRNQYLTTPPIIDGLEFKMEDFSTLQGRKRLNELLR